MSQPHREVEARFLDIDVSTFIQKLHAVGAHDHGEELLTEMIFTDLKKDWSKDSKRVRIRKDKQGVNMSFKQQVEMTVDGDIEIELAIESVEKGTAFLEQLGLTGIRAQEKKRHQFTLGKTKIDIDTWPKIPTYVELEADTEEELRKTAKMLGLDWEKAIFENAKIIIEKYFHFPVGKTKFFTFSKVE